MIIGNTTFELGKRTYLVGILNITPDSFSDGGKYNSVQNAIEHAKQITSNGADIIDVGGESTRPGFTPVSAEEELARVVPVLNELKKNTIVPISIDTQKPTVALKAAEIGVSMVNNCGALKDIKIAEICKEYNITYCITHNRTNTNYNNSLIDCCNDLEQELENVTKIGLSLQNIIIDPGIGFAKNYDQNLEILKNLHLFKKFGCAIMLGISRKSFFEQMLNLPLNKRDEATAVATAIAAKDCDFVRVHNVKINKMAALFADDIVRK
ncbi:MAG: dihydropteroate synthase [Oscillospiraceae bacterium]